VVRARFGIETGSESGTVHAGGIVKSVDHEGREDDEAHEGMVLDSGRRMAIIAFRRSHARGRGLIRVFLTTVILLSAAIPASVGSTQSIHDLLTSYSNGDFEGVRRALAARLDSPGEVESFKRELDQQIGRVSPVLGAAFALEATAAAGRTRATANFATHS
jgi:hypothetical protein